MTDAIFKLKMGYSTAVDGEYIAVGNPTSFLSSSLSGSGIISNKGSVEIFKYSKITDQYNPNFIFYKYLSETTNAGYLSADTSSVDITYINADTSSVPVLGINIEIDTGAEFNPVFYDDSYGVSVDVSGSIVVIGNPYYRYSLIEGSQIFTGSCIDIYDLSDYTSSFVSGTVYLPKYSITNSFDNLEYSTFGESVSIFENKLVVGSSKNNAVYIYTQSLGIWSHYQTLTSPISNSFFGSVVKIDPSGSNRIVVGNKSTGSIPVYVYDYNTSTANWSNIPADELMEDRSITGSLNFISVTPYFFGSQPSGSNYGNSVSIYGDTIIVGAPNDMYYFEWSGSTVLRNRGAVYFWKKCTDATDWFLLQKSFGSDELLESNNLGYSVDIFDDKAIVTSIRDVNQFSSSYIENTVNKIYSCNPNDYIIDTLGQFVLYTSSLSSSWQIKNTVTKKKQYGYPYSGFGYSCGLSNDIVCIGSPLFLTNPIEITASVYDTINGYSYIYNFNDYVTDYHVGNIFYKDGKIILSNSGSIFDNLLKNRSNLSEPKYDVQYNSNIKLYEKQVLCRIETGEFNYSTNPTSLIPNIFDFDIDNNKYFDFIDLDLILKYMNYQINSSYNWWENIVFTNEEQSLFEFNSIRYNISSSYVSNYNGKLSSNFNNFDFDGNNKVNLNDMYILWKYFANTLNQTELFKYLEPKSSRKNIQEIVNYIEEKIGKSTGLNIKTDFFDFNYSSSIDPTGSYLAPYITTVGLYNGGDLVAVAKLGMPIKNSGELPLNILVKWDI